MLVTIASVLIRSGLKYLSHGFQTQGMVVSSLMKRATRLSPETQVTLGGYWGAPPKWSHFRAKTKQLTRAKFVFYFDPEQRFEQGAGSLAEEAREP
jgi:hypothetical protein